jgi:hypothetical protein
MDFTLCNACAVVAQVSWLLLSMLTEWADGSHGLTEWVAGSHWKTAAVGTHGETVCAVSFWHAVTGLDYTVAHYGIITSSPRLDAVLTFVDDSTPQAADDWSVGEVSVTCVTSCVEDELASPAVYAPAWLVMEVVVSCR